MVYIYCLALEKDKYYIGKTNNPQFRVQDHFSNNGTSWTKKYRPIHLIEIIKDCDNYDEDKYTLQYMEKYGINNVRGGSFCEIVLTNSNITTIQQIIKGANDKCYICGNRDHFAKECKNINKQTKNFVNTEKMNEKCTCPTSYISSHRRSKCALNKFMAMFDDEYENIDKLIITTPPVPTVNIRPDNNKSSNVCYRCGRNTHYANKCYATIHLDGHKL